MTPARILHVVSAGQVGGTERVVSYLASTSRSRPTQHAVAVFAASSDVMNLYRAGSSRVHVRGLVREHWPAFMWRSFGPRDLAWLIGVAEEEKSQIIHLHNIGGQVVGTRAALRLGLPIVRTEHSLGDYTSRARWMFASWSLRRSQAAVAVSRGLAREIVTKAPWLSTKLRVVLNGIPVPPAMPAYPDRQGDGAFRFVTVARLEPRKGLDLALEALVAVPGATLDIVGDGESRGFLEQHARALGVWGRVKFHGFTADPSAIVAHGHAALSSSREEGLGLALIEAMALGRPVIAVPVGGIPEIVRHGETGLLARARTSKDLAAVMAQAVAHPQDCRRMGTAARAFVESSLSAAAMAQAYDEIYQAALAAQDRTGG